MKTRTILAAMGLTFALGCGGAGSAPEPTMEEGSAISSTCYWIQHGPAFITYNSATLGVVYGWQWSCPSSNDHAEVVDYTPGYYAQACINGVCSGWSSASVVNSPSISNGHQACGWIGINGRNGGNCVNW